MGQMDEQNEELYEKAWQEVATQLDYSTPKEFHDQRNKETYELRELVHSEFWRLINTTK
jgi:hypothetical protein